MDIGTLTGTIAIEDQVSGVLSRISYRVEQFAGDFSSSFGLIGAGAIVAAGAITAVTAAVTALASHGSDVNDVASTLDNFAGSAQNASEIMQGLRKGTLDTVEDFALMQSATRVLASGAKLTAAEFETLGQAAFAMQNRGLGPTKDMLDLVSQALVTGRTRALAMKLGVIDLGDANANYALSHGIVDRALSQTEKAEAARIQVMKLLTTVSGEAAGAQRDFGEQIEFAMAQVRNFRDDLARQVASSEHVARAVSALGEAFLNAFGGTKEEAIKTIVGWVNRFADSVATYGPKVITTFVDIGKGILNIHSFVREAWDDVPDWLKSIATNAGLVAVAIWSVNAAVQALLGLKLAGWVVGGAKALHEFALAGTAVYQLAGLKGIFAMVAGGITAVVTAAALPTAITALVIGLAGVATALRDAYQAYKDGKSMWDFFARQRSEKDLDWLSKGVRSAIRAMGGESILVSGFDEGTAAITRQKTELEKLLDSAMKVRAMPKPMASHGVTAAGAPTVPPPPVVDEGAAKRLEHLRAVGELTKNLRGQADSVRVVEDALRRLTAADLDNYSVQQRLIPQLETLREAHGGLTAEQQQLYNRIVETNAAMLAKGDVTLRTQGVTLEHIESLKQQGLTEQYIASQYGVSTQQLQHYVGELQNYAKASEQVTVETEERLAREKAEQMQLAQYFQSYVSNGKKLIEITKTGLDARLHAIDAAAEAEIEALGKPPAAATEMWQAAVDRIRQIQQQQRYNVLVDNEVLERSSKKYLLEVAATAKRTYMAMIADAENYSHAAIEAQKRVVEAAEAAAREMTLGDKIMGATVSGLQEAAQRIPSIITDAIIHGASVEQTVKALASTVGAAVGGEIGQAVGGPIGKAVGEAAGAMVGELADALHRSAGEDVVRRAAHDLGTFISEELGDAIAADAKNFFGGDRAAAEVFNIDKLLQAAGGLTTDNIDKYTHKLRDTFVELSEGVFTTAEATRVLDENFGKFAEFFGDGIISQELREIIRLAQDAGLEVGSITDFLLEQAGRARSGLEGILAGALVKKGGEGEDAEDFLPISQEEFDRLSRLTTATFAAARAAGQPFLDVLFQMKDQIGGLNDAATQFGFTKLDVFGDISVLQEFFEANEGLGQSIQGTNELLIALANSNLLTQQSFNDLAATAVEDFNAMIAGGLSFDQAMLAQRETLQTIWELMQEGSLVVDEQTQALIDQAEEAGAVGEAHMDAQERAVKAMEHAADAMERVGDVLTQVFGIAGDEAETFADRTIEAISRIPRNIDIQVSGSFLPGDQPQSDEWPVFGGNMAAGGYGSVSTPTWFRAGEAGEEQYAFSGAGATFPMGEADPALLYEIQGLRGDLKSYQRSQHRTVRDERLRALR